MNDSKYTTVFHSVSRQSGRYFISGDRGRGEGRILLKTLTVRVAEHREELTVFCVGFITWQDPL